MKKILLLKSIILLLLSHSGLKAQEVLTTSGGEAVGSGGTVSYTIGQTLYTTHTSSDGTIAYGVQQPYEISVVSGIEEAKNITLSMVAYPNPTHDQLILSYEGYQGENLTYYIYDLSGKLLETGKLTSNKTTIQMGSNPPALYLLRIYNKQVEAKVFRIIKN